MNVKNKLFVTIVTENYIPLIHKLMESYNIFSNIPLRIYTVNFDFEINIKNIETVRIDDLNINEYKTTKKNKYITSNVLLGKYTLFLKIKILKDVLKNFDYCFFVDCDIIFTKNSDQLFVNCINTFSDTYFPISVKYFFEHSTTHNPECVFFNEHNEISKNCLSYYNLSQLYNTEITPIQHLTTYCIYLSKFCVGFLNEAENIAFNPEVLSNIEKYTFLGDETIFNFLYSKYKFYESINNYLCYDISIFKPIDICLNNILRLKHNLCFIHTKRGSFFEFELQLNDSEYEKIFEILSNSENFTSKLTFLNKSKNDNRLMINVYTSDYESEKSIKVKTSSIFYPDKQHTIDHDLIFYPNIIQWFSFFETENMNDILMIIENHEQTILETLKLG